jgi:hypothetical protein
MASKTILALESQLGDVTSDTRKSYDDLQELYKQLGITEDTLKKKGLLPGVKEEESAKIPGLKAAIKEAEKRYKSFQDKKNSITLEIKRIKKGEEKTKVKEATSKSAENLYQTATEELKAAELGLNGYKGEAKYQDAYRKAQAAYDNALKAGLKPAPLSTPKITVPPVEKKEDKKVDPNAPSTSTGTDDLTAFIATIGDQKNTELIRGVQQDLHDIFGYTGPIDGRYSLPLQQAITNIAAKRDQLPAGLQGTDFRTFLASKDSASLLGLKPGGAGGAGATAYATLSNPTQAAAYINNAFQGILNRDATPKEIANLTLKLNAAEKKNPQKTVNGITTGGINREQFLTDIIKSRPEFLKRKEDTKALTTESLLSTAKANGLTPSSLQLEEWNKRIQNGEDPNIIKKAIRDAAATGLPDNIKKLMADGTDLETIYAPYKDVMYQVLELNPDSINLNDPVLRSAIGSNGEMPIYDFQRALRKDPRWQYTNNAREEVSNSVQGVLKDFGFMG